jgi:hypothetical protein
LTIDDGDYCLDTLLSFGDILPSSKSVPFSSVKFKLVYNILH